MRRRVLALWHEICVRPTLEQDAALYLAGAVFAIATFSFAHDSDYRSWAELAGGTYVIAALASLAIGSVRRVQERATVLRVARGSLALFVLLGAVVVPLVADLVWRAEARPGSNAQPEVAVIERAGDRVAADEGPYLAHPTDFGNAPSSYSHNIDKASYFPYLPGMVPFGLLNAAHLPQELGDARVSLVGFSLIVLALALLVAGRGVPRRLRLLQVLVILPSGALPMATGGDDLPVLALLLLGVVLADRRRPSLAGVAFGLAGTLKLTAWPALVLMAFAVRDKDGRVAPWRYLIPAIAVLVPSVVAGFASGPGAFIENVVRFPLGIAHVKSPAASPFLGEVLTTVFPGDRRVVTALLGVAGVVLVVAYLVRHVPRTPAAACRATAFVLFAATMLAPATRFGYLIYPANFVVWAYFLDGLPQLATGAQSLSSRSMSETESELIAAGLAPPSASLIEPLSSATPSSISQS